MEPKIILIGEEKKKEFPNKSKSIYATLSKKKSTTEITKQAITYSVGSE
jgi:hypothetical protein